MKKLLYTMILVLCATTITAQNVITLDLKQAVDEGQYLLDTDKGHWTETYNPAFNTLTFNNGMFNFSHIPGMFGGEDVGGGMSYWDGFTICSNGDTTDYGMLGSSDGWISEQWGCMAGGGLNEGFETEQGYPYLVAYWGFAFETIEMHSCRVDFDGLPHKVKGVYVCNHPWPYYGTIHGDGFGSAFTEEGDYLSVTAHGLLGGEDTGSSVTLTLSENLGDGEVRGEDWPEGLSMSSDWQWMDLEELGEVDGIYFTMETSDEDPLYGPNAAAYFCLDRMQIYEHETTEAPQRPNGLTANNITESEVTLHWHNNGDATHWIVYLNDSIVGQTTDTLYIYNSLSPFTEYVLKVVAVNDYGQSDAASITAKTIDQTAPTIPTNLEAVVNGPYSIDLTWTASDDNVGVTRYRVYLNGTQEARPKTTAYTLTGLDPDTEYSIAVEAIDASGNVSEQAIVSARTEALLPPLPSVPQQLSAVAINENDVTINWLGDANVDSWVVVANDSLVTEVTDTLCILESLKPFTEYTISVTAKNLAGNSKPALITVKTLDKTAPQAPTELQGDTTTAYSVKLNWTPSVDNGNVTEYRIYLDYQLVGTIDSTTFLIDGLEPSEEYTIAVEAIDEAGNVSEKSEITILTSDDDPMGLNLLFGAQGSMRSLENMVIYTLSGVRINQATLNDLPDGVYIINGKTVSIRKGGPTNK